MAWLVRRVQHWVAGVTMRRLLREQAAVRKAWFKAFIKGDHDRASELLELHKQLALGITVCHLSRTTL